MNYQEYKDIERKANEIGFSLAKVVNNFCDVLTTTGINQYISKGELLDLLFYDDAKNMIKLKPNYRELIFDAVSRAEFVNYEQEITQRQNEIAKTVKSTLLERQKEGMTNLKWHALSQLKQDTK